MSAATRKFCKDCRFAMWPKQDPRDACEAGLFSCASPNVGDLSLVTGLRGVRRCMDARSNNGECGPLGVYWELRKNTKEK